MREKNSEKNLNKKTMVKVSLMVACHLCYQAMVAAQDTDDILLVADTSHAAAATLDRPFCLISSKLIGI